jgi:hypothetical protein
MFETIRRKMEEEARVNEDVMDRMTPMLFKHYYADDEVNFMNYLRGRILGNSVQYIKPRFSQGDWQSWFGKNS